MVDCINSEYCTECNPRTCCYWKYYKGTHSCNSKLDCLKYCRNYDYKIISKNIDLKDNSIIKQVRFKKPYTELIEDKFIPRVELNKNCFELIKDIKRSDIQTIAISAMELFTPKSKLTKTAKKIQDENGIHNYLNYDGNVILTTNILDNLCDILNPNLYMKIIDATKPNIITTLDTYYYDDQPYFITKLKLFYTLKKNIDLAKRIKKPIIAMSIGSYTKLYEGYNRFLYQMGCRYFMIPCYYFPHDYHNGIKKIPDKISILKQICENNKIILIGSSPIKTRKLFLVNNFSSGLALNVSHNKYHQILKYKKLAEDLSYQKTLR